MKNSEESKVRLKEDLRKTREELAIQKWGLEKTLGGMKVLVEEAGKAKVEDEAILSSIGDGVVGCDKDGRVILFNGVAEILTGFSAKEVIGQHYAQSVKFVRESDEKPSNDFIAEAMKTGQKSEIANHTILIRKDGFKIPVADSASPVKNAIGDIIGCVLIFRDVTKEREIDKAKTEFVSIASHQLRTPLGIVKWYLEALQNENYLKKAPKTIRDYFGEINKSNERVITLVGDLLSVSRIDAGTVKNVPKPVDMINLAKDIVREMQVLANHKKVALSLEIKKQPLPGIQIDPLRLHEVIENLIINAVEYTPAKGKVVVTVDKNGDFLLLSVKDSGIGISAAEKDKLFTKFFRSDRAVTKNPEGSGLGLYVVKSYVEGWGGKVSVASVEKKGSTFTISLPIKGGEIR